MPRNFFVSGAPKSGKTTLLRRIVEELKKRGLKVGGFITPEERHHGTRKGFYVQDIETGKIALLASVDAEGPKVSKYHVDIKSFESVAIPSMTNVDNYDVFVIDEIGRMELKSQKFISLLDKIFESPVPLIASLHRDYIGRYGIYGEVVILTPTNREAVFLDLLNKATAEYTKKPKEKKLERREKRKKKGEKRKMQKQKKVLRTKEKTKTEKMETKEEKIEEKAKEEVKGEVQQKKEHGIVKGLRELIGI